MSFLRTITAYEPTAASKFAAFKTTDIVYKTIGNTPLHASILVPKTLETDSGRRPVLVHFHGGGLIVGDKLFEPWFPLWSAARKNFSTHVVRGWRTKYFHRLIQLAEEREAIIITPGYRLIPEATGTEILEDVKDFWTWLHRSFALEKCDIAPRGTSADLDKIAVAGESAGGYLSLQSAFLFPEAKIRLVMAQYGQLDIDHPLYNAGPYTIPPEGSYVDKYIANLETNAIRISSLFPDHWDLCLAILEEGRHRDLIGIEDDRVRLQWALKRAKNPPPMWIAQGTEDQIVPVPVVTDFLNMMKEIHPDTPVHYTLQPGPHGFDGDIPLSADWVKDGCNFIKSFWN